MTWFDDMAEAMRKRETALNGIERWQEKLKIAENWIADLGTRAPAPVMPAPTATAPEPQPEHAPPAPSPDDSTDATQGSDPNAPVVA